MSDRFPCPYCSQEQFNADRLLRHFRRCKALKNNNKIDHAQSKNSNDKAGNANKQKKSTQKAPVKRRARSKKSTTARNTKKKTTTVAARTPKRSQKKKRAPAPRRRQASKSLFSRRRRAVKSGKRKRVVKKRSTLARSPAPISQTPSVVTRPRAPLSRTNAAVSITATSPRLKSIPSDVQLNATAQKLQAQATLIKRLLQENLQLINADKLKSKTLESVTLEKDQLKLERDELKLEKDELVKEKLAIEDQLKTLQAAVDKAKQETEQEKLETAGVRQQLDAAILEKANLEKQLQASKQKSMGVEMDNPSDPLLRHLQRVSDHLYNSNRSVEVNKIREELSETQRQLKAATKRCEESKNSLTATSSLEKTQQRMNTYAYPLQPPNQMFPVYDPRRAYAVSSSTAPIQILPARTMPPKPVWRNYQNTNAPHDQRRRAR